MTSSVPIKVESEHNGTNSTLMLSRHFFNGATLHKKTPNTNDYKFGTEEDSQSLSPVEDSNRWRSFCSMLSKREHS